MKKRSINVMIPARIGSQRLKYKNLSLINGKPLIYYAINAAKKSKLINNIYINSDHKIFEEIANRYKVNFYLRPKKLGSSKALSDDVVHDFMLKNPSDILIWINPIAPLQDYKEIDKCIKYFIKNNIDSLITVNDKKRHFYFKNKPINFNIKNKFDKTQDLIPVSEFVYTIMMWKNKSYIKHFDKYGYSITNGKFSAYPVKSLSGLIVKDANDLEIIEMLMKKKKYLLKYDKVIKKINVQNK